MLWQTAKGKVFLHKIINKHSGAYYLFIAPTKQRGVGLIKKTLIIIEEDLDVQKSRNHSQRKRRSIELFLTDA